MSKVLTALVRIMPAPPRASNEVIASVTWSLEKIAPIITRWGETPAWLREAVSEARGATQVDAGAKAPYGIITQCPLFAALCSQPLRELESTARVAQAALLTSIALLDERRKSEGFASAIRTAGLSVRRIGQGQGVPDELIEALRASGSLQAIADRIKEKSAIFANTTEDEQRLVGGLRALLADALENRAPRKHTSVVRATRVSRRRVADIESYSPSFEIHEEDFEPSEFDIQEGAAAVSESPLRQVISVDVRAIIADSMLNPSQRQWRAKQRARAIASSAQGLMLGSDRLHLADLEALERTIQNHLTGKEELASSTARGALISAVALLTGRSIERLRDFAVVQSSSDVPSSLQRSVFIVSESNLVFPAPNLKKAFVPKGMEATWYQPVLQRLVVPVPRAFGFSSALLRFAKDAVGSRPFTAEHWVSDADLFAKTVNERYGSRITVSRIADFLGRQVLVETGDWADVAFFCGQDDANARLYYYAPTHHHLREIWARVWQGVASGLAYKDAQIESTPPNDIVRIGSRGCPTPAGVKIMVERLLDYCRAKLRGRRSESRVLEVHNAVALYTIVLLLWHCGARAVDEPVELSLYNPANGFLGLSDKDTDTYYSSRVVWLPRLAQRQISAYWAHLATLRSVLGHDCVPEGEHLFLFDKNGKDVKLTQSVLKNALFGFYPYRLNAQRHFHRTMLRELGVPAQVIDAHLGHGAMGQEPYAAHSCFSPARLQDELGPVLDKLMEGAGWVVLNGLG
jgi:hypothetical protein